MIQPKLKAGTTWLTLSDLNNGSTPDIITEQERNAIQFCQRWLNGKDKFVFQTSGSTGTPKKIIFTRAQLESSARLTERALNLQPGYTTLTCLDVNFIAGAMMLVRSLVTGMNMVIKTPSANPLDELPEEIDFAAFVPYQIITLLGQEPQKLDKLRTVIIGGAPLSDEVIGLLQNRLPSFYATYGMTETITHVALQKLNGNNRQDFFQLLPGITASTDDRGCLLLSVPHLGNHPIITNDRVLLLDEKRFRWIGRFDLVINSGGVKVQVEKIERAVATLFQELKIQKRFLAVGIPDQKLGEQVVLVIEGLKLDHDQEEAIKIQLAQQVSIYEMPKALLYTPYFVETRTQKIDRVKTIEIMKAKND